MTYCPVPLRVRVAVPLLLVVPVTTSSESWEVAVTVLPDWNPSPEVSCTVTCTMGLVWRA